jgi:hypothetical protein
MNVKDPGSRLLRWRIKLEEFNYEIVSKSGSQNTNAGFLSRMGYVTAETKGSTKLDDESKKQVLYEFHDAPVGGHQGMNKTFRAIKSRYSWPNMRREIEECVKQCKSCQVNKTLKPKRKAPMGANFVSEMFKNTCKRLKIKKIQSTAFHLESQGSIERNHRVPAEYLRHYVREDQTDWDEWVPFAAYTYNTSEHSSTGYTPLELVFGHPSSLPSALKSEPSPECNYDDYLSELKGRLQTAHHVAKKNLIACKVRSKDYYDKGTEVMNLKVGDKVLLYNETVSRGRSRKLSSQYLMM